MDKQPSERAMMQARELWHDLAVMGLLSSYVYASQAKEGVTHLAKALDAARTEALEDGIRHLDERGVKLKKEHPGAVGLVVSGLVRAEADALRALVMPATVTQEQEDSDGQ